MITPSGLPAQAPVDLHVNLHSRLSNAVQQFSADTEERCNGHAAHSRIQAAISPIVTTVRLTERQSRSLCVDNRATPAMVNFFGQERLTVRMFDELLRANSGTGLPPSDNNGVTSNRHDRQCLFGDFTNGNPLSYAGDFGDWNRSLHSSDRLYCCNCRLRDVEEGIRGTVGILHWAPITERQCVGTSTLARGGLALFAAWQSLLRHSFSPPPPVRFTVGRDSHHSTVDVAIKAGAEAISTMDGNAVIGNRTMQLGPGHAGEQSAR